MNLGFQVKKELRDTLIWLFCFIALPFELYYLYLDIQYNTYFAEYKETQVQETQAVNRKITETISTLRALMDMTGKEIHTAGEDYFKIQNALKAARATSEKHHIHIPTVQTMTYYKLTGHKVIITPSFVAPFLSLPPRFDKPIKDLESFTSRDNEMIGMVPVVDKGNHLKGILETHVSYVNLQKFVGAGNVTTLTFPLLFNSEGKSIILTDPLVFSLTPPLSRTAYFLSHKAYFWILAYAVLIGSCFLFLFRNIIRKQVGLVYGAQIGQLREEWEVQHSSLEARNSFQRHLIHRFKEGAHIVTKVLERFGHSDTSLSSHKGDILLKGATALAETLSRGITNYRREPIFLLDLLTQIKDQMSHKLRELNITWTVTCPESLTFIGDELFTKQILLNALGYPLYYMPKNEEVVVSATQDNGYVRIEVRDHRFVLTPSARAYLNFPEGAIEDSLLRQMCVRHQVGYESYATKEGTFYTRVSFPEDPDNTPHLTLISSSSELLH